MKKTTEIIDSEINDKNKKRSKKMSLWSQILITIITTLFMIAAITIATLAIIHARGIESPPNVESVFYLLINIDF